MNALLRRLWQLATKEELDTVEPAALVAPEPVVSMEDARLLKAALYLKHGFLEECHRIAQQIESPNGAYWHGIMHRHEGDIGNSHYWYRRVGRHPVLEAIGGYPRDAAAEEQELELLLAHTLACATGKEEQQ
ncbi:MAG: hypothetical protein NZ483_05755 [Verrucomicrobiae bacterium]|nr:hypothetical protein [Verrucomicrobiae bacterium]MDW8343527.1 hypothetical protein [Verrucomicrobiae bacterium]